MHGFTVIRSATKSKDRTPVQWMMVQHSKFKTIYIVFRGTYDPQDAVVDMGAIPNFEASDAVGMHSGIRGTLKHPKVPATVHPQLHFCEQSLGWSPTSGEMMWRLAGQAWDIRCLPSSPLFPCKIALQ